MIKSFLFMKSFFLGMDLLCVWETQGDSNRRLSYLEFEPDIRGMSEVLHLLPLGQLRVEKLAAEVSPVLPQLLQQLLQLSLRGRLVMEFAEASAAAVAVANLLV